MRLRLFSNFNTTSEVEVPHVAVPLLRESSVNIVGLRPYGGDAAGSLYW